jgi:hypothetical protein
MPITDEDIKRLVGKEYDPTATYTVQDMHGAMARAVTGTHALVCKIQTKSDGEMVIVRKLDSNKPKQTIMSKLRGAFQ